jgi:hypothetical protein
MTPKDNELRMQIGLVVTHTDDELLFVRSEKNPNTLDALQAFADLVRQDEREACAKLCDDLQLTDLAIRDWADGTYDCAKAIRERGVK